MFTLGTVVVVAASVSALVTRRAIPWLRRVAIDLPNRRSSHQHPIPRGGGVGMVAGLTCGILLGWVFQGTIVNWRILLAGALVAAVGFAEDVRPGLPVMLRLLVHFLAASLVVVGAGLGLDRLPLPVPFDVRLGPAAAPVAVIWLVGVTNIFNFLDGIDGYAASQGLVATLVLGLLGGNAGVAIAAIALGGACAGFLVHNWHPAKLFMGDVGSSLLGFLIGALPLAYGAASRSWVVFVVVACLWFFLSDGAFTLVRRLVGGAKIWQAHRSHLYQRLVISGLRHDQVVVRVMTGATALGIAALVGYRLSSQWVGLVVLGGAITGFAALLWWTRWRETHAQQSAAR